MRTRNNPKKFISIVVARFVVRVVVVVGVDGGDKESDTLSSVRIEDAVVVDISNIFLQQRQLEKGRYKEVYQPLQSCECRLQILFHKFDFSFQN